MIDTVEVPKQSFFHWAREMVFDEDDIITYHPEGVEIGQLFDTVIYSNVDDIDIVDEETLSITGSGYVSEIIERIPKTLHHPVEYKTRERDVLWEMVIYWDEYPTGEMKIEVV